MTDRNLQDVLNDINTAETDQQREALGDEFVAMAGEGNPDADRSHLVRKGTRAEARATA